MALTLQTTLIVHVHHHGVLGSAESQDPLGPNTGGEPQASQSDGGRSVGDDDDGFSAIGFLGDRGRLGDFELGCFARVALDFGALRDSANAPSREALVRELEKVG